MSEPEYVSPFYRPDAPAKGRVVMFHHASDGVDWPAIVSEVRGVDSVGTIWAPTTWPETLQDVEQHHGPITVQAHLTIFRPGHIEWKWAVMGDGDNNWS